MTARRSDSGTHATADARDDTTARLHVLNAAPVRAGGAYVLYWLRAYRRATDNLALDHAVARANALALPLVVYEALDPRYPFASDRLHAFVLEGACAMRAAVEARGAAYAFYLPRTRAEAHAARAVARLAARAALVVTDWYPPAGGAASLWARSAAFAATLACRVEAIDDAAVVPMAPFAARREAGARTIRARVMAALPPALAHPPRDPAVTRPPPRELEWPFAPTLVTREAIPALLAACEIDHAVPPVAHTPGGLAEARARLDGFVRRALRSYDAARNDMARVGSSRLSPYLHFGQISPRAVLRAVQAAERVPEAARAAFVEELAVRRALAFSHVMTAPDAHATYGGAVPAWARATLAEHARDARAGAHTLAEWEAARTADPLWNAAQRELVRDGVVHPYARMLWGKVALTLAARPEDAFAWLVYLNDRYALDGRDPNTYTNIAWCFGLHDHPYPSRPVYGTVRSMTSRAAARKWDVSAYLARNGGSAADLASI